MLVLNLVLQDVLENVERIFTLICEGKPSIYKTVYYNTKCPIVYLEGITFTLNDLRGKIVRSTYNGMGPVCFPTDPFGVLEIINAEISLLLQKNVLQADVSMYCSHFQVDVFQPYQNTCNNMLHYLMTKSCMLL